jgi:hypothetical protein
VSDVCAIVSRGGNERDDGDKEGVCESRDFEEILKEVSLMIDTKSRNTDSRVGEDDGSTCSPLTADSKTSSKCSAPVLAVEDFKE